MSATKLEKYTYALGRRKTSVATVRLFQTKGQNLINEKSVETFLSTEILKIRLFRPFKVLNLNLNDFYFTAKVLGGGTNSQMEAIRLGIARALVAIFPDRKKELKNEGLLTRDPRMVERKKTGLRKARKSEQYSKR